jgi:hypothetical protein
MEFIWKTLSGFSNNIPTLSYVPNVLFGNLLQFMLKLIIPYVNTLVFSPIYFTLVLKLLYLFPVRVFVLFHIPSCVVQFFCHILFQICVLFSSFYIPFILFRYKICSVWNTEGKHKLWQRWEDNIMEYNEIWRQGVDWIQLAQNRVQSVVDTIMNLGVP